MAIKDRRTNNIMAIKDRRKGKIMASKARRTSKIMASKDRRTSKTMASKDRRTISFVLHYMCHGALTAKGGDQAVSVLRTHGSRCLDGQGVVEQFLSFVFMAQGALTAKGGIKQRLSSVIMAQIAWTATGDRATSILRIHNSRCLDGQGGIDQLLFFVFMAVTGYHTSVGVSLGPEPDGR